MQSDDIDKRRESAESDSVIDNDKSFRDKVKKNTARESSPDVDDEIIFVPNNPRTWSEKNIETWLKWAAKKFNLHPALDDARIPKDAEELANFNKAEFYVACGSFDGGKMLSQHYKYMMESAQEKYHETLLTDGDPG